MGARYPWLDFQYSDPEPGFDRSQVYGVAAKLFTMKDIKFAVALDTAGGGKVNNTFKVLFLKVSFASPAIPQNVGNELSIIDQD